MEKLYTYITRPTEGQRVAGSEYAAIVGIFEQRRQQYFDDFLNLACNAVVIDGLPPEVPQDYILQVLFSQGAVARYKPTGDYYQVSGTGSPDLYGYPTRYVLTGGNGKSFRVKADAVDILKCNPLATPITPIIDGVAQTLAYIDGAIDNNLSATQSTRILTAEDKDQVASIRTAQEQRRMGCPAVVVRKDIGEALTAIDVTVPYIADRLAELKRGYRDGLLQHLGTLTANRDKRERVQTAEVNAGVGEAVDYIYTTIDTFNRDAERSGLSVRMRLNASIEEIYTESVESEATPDEV